MNEKELLGRLAEHEVAISRCLLCIDRLNTRVRNLQLALELVKTVEDKSPGVGECVEVSIYG